MVETLRYELITLDDLAIGHGDVEQQLADGRVVRLRQLHRGNLGIPQTVRVPATAAQTQLSATFRNPNGARIHGVTMAIITPPGTSNGLTSFDMGDAVILDRWGATLGILPETESSSADFRDNDEPIVSANYTVLLTQNGGDFDGIGAIDVQIHFSLISHQS